MAPDSRADYAVEGGARNAANFRCAHGNVSDRRWRQEYLSASVTPMPEYVSPIVHALNAPCWSAAEEGQLLLPFCVTTEKYFWPPSPVSPFITSGETSWRSAQPLGVLRAKVIFRRVFQKALERPLSSILHTLWIGYRSQ